MKPTGKFLGVPLPALALGLSLPFLAASGCAFNGGRTTLNADPATPATDNLPPAALIHEADRLFQEGEYADAAATLIQFDKRFAGHELEPYALYRLGESYSRLSVDAHHGQDHSRQALAVFERLQKLYPNNSYKEEIKNLPHARYNQIGLPALLFCSLNMFLIPYYT
jgi:hypothetical protein